MKGLAILAVVLAALLTALNSFFIVGQTEQAIILQFGKPVEVTREPGLKFKIPWYDVKKFDTRILDLSSDPREVISADQKRLIVDSYAKYRITDPLKFYQAVRDEMGVRSRIGSVLDSSIREVLGGVQLNVLLTGKRGEIMQRIKTRVNAQAKSFGVDVVDVRIKRADLPKENSDAIYRRMQTEREREAKEFRAMGAEESVVIKSKADRERTRILSEAGKSAEITRGEGDAEATKIFAEAYGKDPSFSSFYRTMKAYREVLKKDDTTVILSPQGDFMKQFNKME